MESYGFESGTRAGLSSRRELIPDLKHWNVMEGAVKARNMSLYVSLFVLYAA
jgi:hypothetical protein